MDKVAGLSKEAKESLIQEFQMYNQVLVREVFKTAVQSRCKILSEELQALLKQEGCRDRIYRQGGYLDGFQEGINFIEEFIERLKYRDSIEPKGY